MGGCASRPQELVDAQKPVPAVEQQPAVPELTKPVEAGVEAKNEIAEEPLVDLSTPKAEEDAKAADELAPGISELKPEVAVEAAAAPPKEEAPKEAAPAEEATKEAEKESEIVEQPSAEKQEGAN